MNGYDRYVNLIEGKNIDYIPRIPILMQFAAEYIGSNYAEFASDYNFLVKSNITCANDFSIDQLSAISDPYRETHGFGAKIKYQLNGVPMCINPPLEKSKNLSNLLMPNPLISVRMLDRLNALKTYKNNYNKQYSIMGWIEGPAAEAANLRTGNNFFTDLLINAEFIEDLMDICTDVEIEFAKAQIKNGADTIGIGDAVASLVSVQHYEKFIQPREKKIVKKIHDMGAYVRLHICGNITHILSGIADLGVDILDVDHMVNMADVRKNVGDNTVLAGNIDPVQSVLMGKPDKIEEYNHQIYNEVGNPYMIAAGCEIPSGTPPENLKALCKPIKYNHTL